MFYYCHVFKKFLNFNSNSVDPAVSDLGLHCLPVSLLWDARNKRVYIYRAVVSSVSWTSSGVDCPS